MKRSIILSPVLFILISFSSCLNVFQPVFEDHDLITNETIAGVWNLNSTPVTIELSSKSKIMNMLKLDIGKSGAAGVTEKTDSADRDKSYVISFGKDAIVYHYSLQMAKIDGSTFAQLIPIIAVPKDTTENFESRYIGFMGQDLIGTYAIAKLSFNGKNNIQLNFIDGEKIKGLVLGSKMKIPYAYDEMFNNFLITAGSATLKSFLIKYGNREDLYSSVHTYSLKR